METQSRETERLTMREADYGELLSGLFSYHGVMKGKEKVVEDIILDFCRYLLNIRGVAGLDSDLEDAVSTHAQLRGDFFYGIHCHTIRMIHDRDEDAVYEIEVCVVRSNHDGVTLEGKVVSCIRKTEEGQHDILEL